jgi:hypothetical protein
MLEAAVMLIVDVNQPMFPGGAIAPEGGVVRR